ncbi:MAG: hypothetical protein WC262_07770 [Bacteroidales bacterium]|jgi:hypothetical protein
MEISFLVVVGISATTFMIGFYVARRMYLTFGKDVSTQCKLLTDVMIAHVEQLDHPIKKIKIKK